MHRIFIFVVSLCVLCCLADGADFNLAAFGAKADGITDDTAAFQQCFLAVSRAGGGMVTIPPGDYFLQGDEPMELASRTTVFAYGSRFHLPQTLGDRARLVLFHGQDVHDFNWFGGHFVGRCFDPRRDDNTWEPNANTRMLVFTTKAAKTYRLKFRDITSDRIAGAVIHVEGQKEGGDTDRKNFATNITVDNCTLLDSGKFMWDYGYLWQITVWPEDHSPQEQAMANRYFRNDLIRGPLTMEAGEDRVLFENTKPLPLSKGVCFFGDSLPSNLVRGKRYFIVETTPKFIRIALDPGGEPLRFQGAAGPKTKLIYDLFAAYVALYAPTGAGPGKGGVDITRARNVRITECRLSALGDTMHVQRCHNVVLANNQIVGSRMGAFFIAEYCKNVTVTGNTVDGTNGSRVLSVEKSAQNVTIIGNTFRNGGRGSWINQPRNLVLQGNIFINNTTKCEADPSRGRRSYISDGYVSFAELYFTTHEPQGHYGNVVVRDNIFVTGANASHAILFHPGGEAIMVTDNVFSGEKRTIQVEPGCKDITIRDNLGLEESK